MIFGSSLIKEVDHPAISKMGPKLSKLPKLHPKCKESPVAGFGPKGTKCGTNIRIEIGRPANRTRADGSLYVWGMALSYREPSARLPLCRRAHNDAKVWSQSA